jgi:RHO1 GDP-GTP exchange protein 1/2
MERPAGPRQPDNKRHTAYQDIFGRSGQAQPRTGYPASTYGAYPGPSQQPAYGYTGQTYLDPRQAADGHGAYAQSVYGVPYAQPQPAPISYHQPTYYAQSAAPQNYYPGYAQSTYAQTPYSQPQMLSPPQPAQSHSRTKSVASSRHIQGAISPRPEEPPDPQLEAYIRAGMTPAQAYQQHVYMQGQAPSYQPSAYASSGYTATPESVPRIGLSLDSDDGRLGIDFGEDSQSSSGTDEGVNGRHSGQSVQLPCMS